MAKKKVESLSRDVFPNCSSEAKNRLDTLQLIDSLCDIELQ